MLQTHTNSNKPSLEHPAFTVLGLSTPEQKILIALWGMGKTLSMISRATKIPRTTLPYMLKKLEKRGLVIRLTTVGDGRYWKSNMIKAVGRIRSLYDIVSQANDPADTGEVGKETAHFAPKREYGQE